MSLFLLCISLLCQSIGDVEIASDTPTPLPDLCILVTRILNGDPRESAQALSELASCEANTTRGARMLLERLAECEGEIDWEYLAKNGYGAAVTCRGESRLAKWGTSKRTMVLCSMAQPIAEMQPSDERSEIQRLLLTRIQEAMRTSPNPLLMDAARKTVFFHEFVRPDSGVDALMAVVDQMLQLQMRGELEFDEDILTSMQDIVFKYLLLCVDDQDKEASIAQYSRYLGDEWADDAYAWFAGRALRKGGLEQPIEEACYRQVQSSSPEGLVKLLEGLSVEDPVRKSVIYGRLVGTRELLEQNFGSVAPMIDELPLWDNFFRIICVPIPDEATARQKAIQDAIIEKIASEMKREPRSAVWGIGLLQRLVCSEDYSVKSPYGRNRVIDVLEELLSKTEHSDSNLADNARYALEVIRDRHEVP